MVYLFLCFAAGCACLGVALGHVLRRRDSVSKAFLAFYGFLSLMVTASLLLALDDATGGLLPPWTSGPLGYLVSIVGLYGVMLSLPLLTHRVFGVQDPRRDRVVVVTVLSTLALQHVTEFYLGSTVWDERGDWFEDGVLVGLAVYVLWMAWNRLDAVRAQGPLPTRLFALLAVGTPAACYDLTLGEGLGLHLFPLWYCLASIVLTSTLSRDAVGPEDTQSADLWGLSQREFQVAGQVAQGLSNKEVAAALHISTNTVKTHLRKVFEKAGVQSRFELMSRMGTHGHESREE